MICGTGLPSRALPSGIGRRPTCKRSCPCWRPISATPATPIPPITSPAQRNCWAWQPIAHSAVEVPHERALFPSAAAGVLLSQPVVKQRNASLSTIASYRDALRMLILFAAEHAGRKPCALAVADLDRDLVLAFLDELEQKRKNTIQTRNARLAAIRSFFHHVAANDPASLGIAQRVLAIPIKRSHTEVTHHLARQEFDALIDAPDQRTPRGRRDRTLLLFLGRTGARVSEALGVDARDLRLDRARPQVLLRGKGRKERIVPLPSDLVKALKALMRERGLEAQEQRRSSSARMASA